VHYGQIVGNVQGSCGVDLVTADRLTARALRGLAVRLMSLSAPHLAHRLPSPLGSELREEDIVDDLAVDRFYDDVASGARVPVGEARRAVQAVVTVLRQTMTEQDFEAVFETLPADYLELSVLSQRGTERP
jgi:uncharacterized protein (DUF2267 family)